VDLKEALTFGEGLSLPSQATRKSINRKIPSFPQGAFAKKKKPHISLAYGAVLTKEGKSIKNYCRFSNFNFVTLQLSFSKEVKQIIQRETLKKGIVATLENNEDLMDVPFFKEKAILERRKIFYLFV